MLRVFALALVVPALLQAPVSAQEAWQTVTSKEGQFTVEMPGKPTINQNKIRKGVGGNVKTIMLGCIGDGGAYFALKVVMPTSIVKGTEDAELDAERDGLAKEWNGKVIGERKIRAGDKVGRDFTVRGVPKKELGTVTIRVREYLAGDSVYIVAVMSRPNRELPDDSGRYLGSLALGEAKVRAQGTPAPEPKGVEMPGWGLKIDPDNDCEITDLKKSLRFNVPAKRHDLTPDFSMVNAPRVMREVEGDFVVTVKVVGEFRPGGRSTNPRGVPYNGAGILVWSDPANFIRFERAAVARPGKIHTYVNFGEYDGGTAAANHNEAMMGGDCWMRIERKGSRIHGSVSFDGTTWKELKPIQTVWPATLKVGVTAVSSSGLPFAVTFEEFDLKGKTK
jgi:regulation of enolase protein 1 (concanavalin A-like superfamily)